MGGDGWTYPAVGDAVTPASQVPVCFINRFRGSSAITPLLTTATKSNESDNLRLTPWPRKVLLGSFEQKYLVKVDGDEVGPPLSSSFVASFHHGGQWSRVVTAGL